ncbi:MAG: hypothetical protein GTO14_23700 [Anaerolineales bacterium]|nr:hypothetical protein [Anaerolineales bacterium]
MTLKIPENLLSQIWQHGSQHYPEEGAGLLLGTVERTSRRVEKLMPLVNRFSVESRHNRYKLEPKDMLYAEQEAERLGLDVIGVFHSHPDHPPNPSEFDRQWALPWYSYIITSVNQGTAVESRAWRLAEDRTRFVEEHIERIETHTMEETQ